MTVVHNKKDGTLTITIPTNDPPVASKSGKTKLVATTNGAAVSTCLVDGEVVTINLNAYIPNKAV